MGNMSYCRFTNTVQDLRDCYDNMDDDDLSRAEARARIQLVRLCKRISDNYGDDLEAMEAELKMPTSRSAD